jgi:hypothetical protein
MAIMTENQFPPGWDEARVRRVIAHYESQTESQAIAEDDAAFESGRRTVAEVPGSCFNQQSSIGNQHSSEAR